MSLDFDLLQTRHNTNRSHNRTALNDKSHCRPSIIKLLAEVESHSNSIEPFMDFHSKKNTPDVRHYTPATFSARNNLRSVSRYDNM
jgi:hypothetical protein